MTMIMGIEQPVTHKIRVSRVMHKNKVSIMAGQYNVYLSTEDEEKLIDFMNRNFNTRDSINNLLKYLVANISKLTIKTENGK